MSPARHTHAVLVLDDDDACRESLSAYLEAVRFDVQGAATGEAALAMLAEDRFRPCVALVDLCLPGIDGFDVLREVRARPASDVAVIVLSGIADPAEARRALQAGASAYVAKPTDPDLIERLVAQHCARQDRAPRDD